MRLRKRVLMVPIAVAVIATYGWIASGFPLWSELEAARGDPVRYLADAGVAGRAQAPGMQRSAATIPLSALASSASATSAPPTPSSLEAELRALGLDLERQRALDGPAARGDAPLSEQPEARQRLQAALVETERRVRAVHEQVTREFAAVEASITAAHLPHVIQQRQHATRERYQLEIDALFAELARAQQSNEGGQVDTLLASVAARLGRSRDERSHAAFDPARMPFSRARAGKVQVAELSSQALVAQSAQPAAAPPVADDLAATEDAPITPEVRALAASLGNQPVAIFRWVHDNVAFVPTYGSVQGAQMTLDARRGNAFDTSSLLVALLRAAGIASRYVMGRVDIPVAQVMNWLGGAASPAVCQQLLGQGGIPNVGMIDRGVMTHIRVDHVWVEAFVDYVPSRGAVHRQGDTWIPLDAAFKQHRISAPSSFFTDMPLAQVIDPDEALFEVDESLGMITDVDDSALGERLVDWASRSDEYLRTRGIADSTALLGGATVIADTRSVFAASSPYSVVTRASASAALPASVRHAVTLVGYASDLDRMLESPSFSARISLPSLNSRRLGLQFDPASSADEATLAALRAGTGSSLPVYLVQVVPTIKVDGTTIATGSAMAMGTAFFMDVVLQGPDGSTPVSYELVAGDEIVVGVTGNGVAPEVAEKRFHAHPVDNAPEYLHQVQLHYWAECDHLAEVSAKAHHVHMLRLPSVGVFSSPLTVAFLFGIPRTGAYQSRSMDVKHSLHGAAGADPAEVIAFMKQAGMQSSYLEGAVFDQLRDASAAPSIRGFSAVRLIWLAASQGIPVYYITADNEAAVLPRLALAPEVMADIRTGVAQGKTVLVSERDVKVGAWTGVGYIIQDETNGTGAYLISGGLAGGGLIDCLRKLVPIFEKVGEFLLALAIAILIILILIGALGTAPIWAPAAAGAAAGVFLLFWLSTQSMGSLTPLEA